MEIDDHTTDRPSASAMDAAIRPSGSSRKRRHPESVRTTSTGEVAIQRSSWELLEVVENPNFEELARWNPNFLQAWNATKQEQRATGKPFSACVSQAFTVSLTRALLKSHLKLELPYLEDHHLCPPVPNRFFYLHWIHTELLPSSRSRQPMSHSWQQQQPHHSYCGLDIGAGATAIYSLLAAQFFGTRMVSTEIDPQALQLALANVQANHPVASKIDLRLVTPSHSQDPSQPQGGPLARALALWQQPQPLDFVMTNPPFYDHSSMEVSDPRKGDGRARTAMTVSEGAYPGGEIGFVLEMIADSLRARHTSSPMSSARWYSSMLGKKTSLIHLHKLLLHLLGPTHVVMTEYGPGQYTRWFLAWNFDRPIAMDPKASVVVPCHQQQPPQDPKKSSEFFVTTLDETGMTVQAALSEVVARIIAFCQSSPGGWNLVASETRKSGANNANGLVAEIQIQEQSPPSIVHFIDELEPKIAEQIPPVIVEALQGQDNSDLMPAEGHFVIVATVDIVTTTPTTTDNSMRTSPINEAMNESSATKMLGRVKLDGYGHSARGLKAIQKIGSTIQGEVGRTNRKWRRIRQRLAANAGKG